MTRQNAIFYLLIIGVVGVAIRAASVWLWGGLSFDEVLSVSVASQPLSEMWTYLRWEMHPPLHFLYLKAWLNLFGSSAGVIRLSAVLLGLLSIGSMYLLGREIFQSRKVGLYAALLVSLSVGTVVHSVIARMYGLLFLLGTLSFYLFWRAAIMPRVDNGYKSKLYWIAYTVITLLAIYTHLTALLIPAIQLLYLLYLRSKQALTPLVFRKFFIAAFVYTLFYLPWFVNFVSLRLVAFDGSVWFFYKKISDIFLINIPLQFLIGSQISDLVALVALVFFLGIALLSGWRFVRNGPGDWRIKSLMSQAHILSIFIFALPLFALFTLNLNAIRFYTLSFIGVVLWLAVGLDNLTSRLSRKFSLLVTVMLVAIFLGPINNVIASRSAPWSQIANFIEQRERPTDRIISAFSASLLAVKYYYDGNLDMETLVDPAIKSQVLNDLELVMRTNFLIYAKRETVQELADLVDDSRRIFYVFERNLFGSNYELFHEWFLDNGWQRVDWLRGAQDQQVWLLEKT